MASTVAAGALLRSKYAPLLAFQVLLLVLFAVFVRYEVKHEAITNLYPMFQDVQVMIFIGFGFLMTFLKRYGYSALGFNWLLGALVVQWALLCQSFFSMEDGKIRITLLSLVEADIMAAAVLISFGALLGRTTGPQLLVVAVIETAVGCSNLYLVTEVWKVADCGGSIAIHTFGAYFGLGVSAVMRLRKFNHVADASNEQDNGLAEPSYSSDITAMIGSVFLWIFWPSFNAALVETPGEQYRAIVNTYLSLAAATVTAFAVSSIVTHGGKFDMVHVQNSTLAGGVAVGSVCNMHVAPAGALAIGVGAGLLSVIGYKYLTPRLERCIGLKDTCGVHNLHGMPGVYSGLLSAVFAALATVEIYGSELASVFPAMKGDELLVPETPTPGAIGARSAQQQALYQLLGLAVTMLIAGLSGALTGLLIKLPLFSRLGATERYDDARHWELPNDALLPIGQTTGINDASPTVIADAPVELATKY